jgi:hypothetical protein
VSIGSAERASRRAGQGRQGRAGQRLWRSKTSSCWGLADKVSEALAEAERQRAIVQGCGRAQGGCVPGGLLLAAVAASRNTQSLVACYLLVAAVTKKETGDWGCSRESGQGRQSPEAWARARRGRRGKSDTHHRQETGPREDCKMREPTLEAIRMALVMMMRGI